MSVDVAHWKNTVHLSQLINVYFQYRDAVSLDGVRTVLVIGVTNKLEAEFFKCRGFEVRTFDIDPVFEPDELGSCHDLSRFPDQSFDLVIVSHVLEHLPASLMDQTLSEIARVGRNALIYLPVAGRHLAVNFNIGSRLTFALCLDLFQYWHRPTGEHRKYRFGEHYWELGYRGFRVSQMRERFGRFFHVKKHYRNVHWLPSYNFVLTSQMSDGI